jgi:hypothetical protein
LFCLITGATSAASAFERQIGQNNIRLTAQGWTGAFDRGKTFSDYLIRLQISRMMPNRWNIGMIYSYDRSSNDNDKFARDSFAYVETEWGRLESGWTESIASKLALTLPDVGGTRLNNAPFFLPDGFRGITNPTVRGNQYAWRLNAATLPTRPWQFGVGQTIGRADGFNRSTDIGIRYRNPYGRTKTSVSFGFSYIDRPFDLTGDAYLPPTFARARYQATGGFNLQNGSLIWAITAKAIVDNHPIGFASDGLQAGTGLSYDFLAFSASASYVFSNVGIWRPGDKNIAAHTGILSARYKITKYFNLWASAGATYFDDAPRFFLSGGIGTKF